MNISYVYIKTPAILHLKDVDFSWVLGSGSNLGKGGFWPIRVKYLLHQPAKRKSEGVWEVLYSTLLCTNLFDIFGYLMYGCFQYLQTYFCCIHRWTKTCAYLLEWVYIISKIPKCVTEFVDVMLY